MKFTAIAVKEGDCFLLEYPKDEKTIKVLVDGGKDEDETVVLFEKLVQGEGEAKKSSEDTIEPDKHINLIICTHYDTDHINGILGLLKNGYTYDEIWLPEIIGSLAAEIKGKNTEEILIAIDKASYEIYLAMKECSEDWDKKFRVRFGEGDEDRESIDDKVLSDERKDSDYDLLEAKAFEFAKIQFINELIEITYQYRHCTFSYFHKRECSDKYRFLAKAADLFKYMSIKYDLFQLVDKAVEAMIILTKLKKHSKSSIVWLEYTNKLVDEKISANFEIISLNSKISRIRPGVTLSALLYTYSLTPINKASLVFKFEHEKYPNVLFNADSDYNFNKTEYINLKRNSIATAPHHGSGSNEMVYDRITGDSIIYVRSDKEITPYRPCKKYTSLKHKYCTICNDKSSSPQNVVLTLESTGFFKVSKVPCNCKAK